MVLSSRSKAVERHRSCLPPLTNPQLEEALHTLEGDGLLTAEPEQASRLGMDAPDDPDLFAALERTGSGSTARMKASEFASLTPLYMAGLDPRLLELAERYIGLPPLYLGFEIKVEFPDGRAGGTRNWHRDLEDVRALKVVAYLTDVDEDDGPLQYVPENAPVFLASANLGIHCDDDIDTDHKVSCTAPAKSVIIFDGARLVHRVKPPTGTRIRRSLMYSYTSRRPLQIFAGARPSAEAKRELRKVLTKPQFACIP